jgi:hypothetical protein
MDLSGFLAPPSLNPSFDRDADFTVHDTDVRKAWTHGTASKMMGVKCGQLKLLICEIQFLTLYWNPIQTPRPQLVYVGSASGHHIVMLSQMYPAFYFHLYDSNPFAPALESISNVTLYKRYFNESDVATFRDRDDVYFISDIRSSDYIQGDVKDFKIKKRNEEIVEADMIMQMKWVTDIQPLYSHLKFRLPYGEKFNLEKGTSCNYLSGTLYLQPWASKTSSELRLVSSSPYTTIDWDYVKIEEIMYNHNSERRSKTLYINPLTGVNAGLYNEVGFDDSWESVFTIVVLMEYLQKIGVSPTPEIVKKMLDECVLHSLVAGKSLNDYKTGRYVEIEYE